MNTYAVYTHNTHKQTQWLINNPTEAMQSQTHTLTFTNIYAIGAPGTVRE